MTSRPAGWGAGQGGARLAAGLALAAAVLFVAGPFFAATTFTGDDYLFLAFARHAPNPLAAFVTDQHGGEYYRPLPMLVWWVLGRLSGGSTAPFAALALGLHAAAAALLGLLVAGFERPRRRTAAALAAAVFFVAPQNLEAAYWYAASTDLLATVFVLASLVTLVRGCGGLSAVLALAAYLSKETALVLPALAWVVQRPATEGQAGGSATPKVARLARVVPHLVLALAVAGWRWHVLGGWGGGGEAAAPVVVRLLQIAGGLLGVATGTSIASAPAALVAGGAVTALLVVAAARRWRSGDRGAGRPFLLVLLAVVPLIAAPWVVGARYFYLPSAGLAWAAGEALAGAGGVARALTLVGLLAAGGLQAAARRADVVDYRGRVAAVEAAIASGVAGGHRVFFVASAVKDLDLVVEASPVLASRAEGLLVLCDVPASFATIPADLEGRARFLVAEPPIPPSGAYRFGSHRIVGLARREANPSLEDVFGAFPDLRVIRLVRGGDNRLEARDVTDALRPQGTE